MKSKTFQLPEGYKQSSVQEGIEDALRLHNARFSDILAVWDTDGDGTVSRKEFIAGLASMGIRGSKTDFGALFDFWDIDQGGSLDAKELQRALRTKDSASLLWSILLQSGPASRCRVAVSCARACSILLSAFSWSADCWSSQSWCAEVGSAHAGGTFWKPR